jgi:hypothetical protein
MDTQFVIYFTTTTLLFFRRQQRVIVRALSVAHATACVERHFTTAFTHCFVTMRTLEVPFETPLEVLVA